MKLINKKTGQIAVFGEGIVNLQEIGCKNVAEMLEAGWEDYKEPKEFYFIDQFMSVSKGVVDDVEYAGRNSAVNYAKKTSNNLKTAGNYFETREEAEEAVEKLKAWKRLKDKGFRFEGFGEVTGYANGIAIYAKLDNSGDYAEDLDLLFGGDEDDYEPTNAEINDLTDMGYGG